MRDWPKVIHRILAVVVALNLSFASVTSFAGGSSSGGSGGCFALASQASLYTGVLLRMSGL